MIAFISLNVGKLPFLACIDIDIEQEKSKPKMTRNKRPVKYAVVDAFTESEFKGNPAAVCLLEDERDDVWCQSLATEFNLSETCFLTRNSSPDSPIARFQLRWFTPVAEVELCGHATLAAAHFCFTSGLVNGHTIEFSTLSGTLGATKVLEAHSDRGETEQFLIELDFPAVPFSDYISNDTFFVSKALSDVPVIDIKVTAGGDLLVILPSAQAVLSLQPHFEEIKKYTGRGVIVTAIAAPDSGFDFFSRFFGPRLGVNEDPVTGSAHCALAVYWSIKLGKCDFLAYQASRRGGILKLHLDEQTNRVQLQGKAITIMEGSVLV